MTNTRNTKSNDDFADSLKHVTWLADIDRANLMVRAMIANDFDRMKALAAMRRWVEINQELTALVPEVFDEPNGFGSFSMFDTKSDELVHNREIASKWLALHAERDALMTKPMTKDKRSSASVTKDKSRARAVKELTVKRRAAVKSSRRPGKRAAIVERHAH